MGRLLAYVGVLAVLIAGAVWLADHPGHATIEWLGWRLSTPVPVILVVLATIIALAWTALRLAGALLQFPLRWRRARASGRQRKGYLALTDGMAAAAAGHGEEAGRLAKRAEKLLADPALTRVLAAQSARLSGDEAGAERHLKALLERHETKPMALRGLLDQALARGDHATAIHLGRQARRLSPRDAALAETLFPLLVVAQHWEEAIDLVIDAQRFKVMARDLADRRRALVFHARALAEDAQNDRQAAMSSARLALAADPGLTDVAVHLAAWHGESGDKRRALRILQRAWTQAPVPALAAACRALEPDLAPLPRIRQLERLVSGQPEHVETLLVLGEASLDAKLWGPARKLLTAAATLRPTAQPYRLLARLEVDGYNDQPAARRWLDLSASAAPDPLWQCRQCGHAQARWTMNCASCGTLDGYVWRSPAAAKAPAQTADTIARPPTEPGGFATPPVEALHG